MKTLGRIQKLQRENQIKTSEGNQNRILKRNPNKSFRKKFQKETKSVGRKPNVLEVNQNKFFVRKLKNS